MAVIYRSVIVRQRDMDRNPFIWGGIRDGLLLGLGVWGILYFLCQ